MKSGDGTVQSPYNELTQGSWLCDIEGGEAAAVDVHGGRAVEVVIYNGDHNPSMELNIQRPGTGNTFLYCSEIRAKLPFISGIDASRASQVAEAARQRVREEQSIASKQVSLFNSCLQAIKHRDTIVPGIISSVVCCSGLYPHADSDLRHEKRVPRIGDHESRAAVQEQTLTLNRIVRYFNDRCIKHESNTTGHI